MRLTLATVVIIAGCAAASFPNSTSARAEQECLSAPGGAAPEGRHWYYRSDKATGRRCWYLAEKGKKGRQAASPMPSPRSVADQPADAPSAMASAEAPAVAGSADTPEGAQRPVVAAPVAPPNDVVTQFSQSWPNFARPASTVGRGPASAGNSNAEETQPAGSPQEDTVQPVLPAEERAAAETSPAQPFNAQRVLVMLVGSLCLAGIIMGLVCALSSIRLRRRVARTWKAEPAPWHAADSASDVAQPDAMDTTVAQRHAADLDRETQIDTPLTLRAEALQELEKLQDLLDMRRRRAA